MSKKIIVAILIMALLLLGGCMTTHGTETKRMSCIYNDGFALIWRDNLTGVQYLQTGNGLCVMVDKDGNPLIEEGEDE